MVVFDTFVVRAIVFLVEMQCGLKHYLKEHIFFPSSLTRNLLFELCLVDMLLIAKELKHPKQTSKLLHVLESTRIVATLRCLVTLIL